MVAPKDLKAVHDEYVAKAERQRIKEQREKDRKRAEEDEAKFEELKGRYTGLVMTDGEIVVHTLNSVAEYYDEGSRQHICVGSSSYYLKENTLVFTAKIKDKTIATIEISPQRLLNHSMQGICQQGLPISRPHCPNHQRQYQDDSREKESISLIRPPPHRWRSQYPHQL